MNKHVTVNVDTISPASCIYFCFCKVIRIAHSTVSKYRGFLFQQISLVSSWSFLIQIGKFASFVFRLQIRVSMAPGCMNISVKSPSMNFNYVLWNIICRNLITTSETLSQNNCPLCSIALLDWIKSSDTTVSSGGLGWNSHDIRHDAEIQIKNIEQALILSVLLDGF